MAATIHFDNSYGRLPGQFYTRQQPMSVAAPQLVRVNQPLARALDIDLDWLSSEEGCLTLAGNRIPSGADPLATVYAGHQFGSYNPRLGDGRALLLGEVIAGDGKRYDLQLKGAGPTPYSRGGDGRAPLGPILREFVVSEAMHALGIPTTRALAVVATGEPVFRQEALPGAVVTRIASSHIRVGTFQFFAAQGDPNPLRQLAGYVIDRHFPYSRETDNSIAAVLRAVVRQQAKLVAAWQLVGFIHGVMNTDNMAISGETIDYGPCAFMDTYDPQTVFSSIDELGRYAYFNQPSITKWNLARFAECLIPLIDPKKDKAIEIATETINSFDKSYETKWINMMRDKLGLFGQDQKDQVLIIDLLTWMHKNKADYTNTFCFLMDENFQHNKIYNDENFLTWKERWKERLKLNNNTPEKYLSLMKSVNPLVIPRNHKVEEVLESANNNDLSPLKKLIKVLEKADKKDLRVAGMAALSSSLIYRMKVENIFALQKAAMENKPIKQRSDIDIQMLSLIHI